MSWKIFFSLIFSLIVIFLLTFYWFFPLDNVEFNKIQQAEEPENFNFTLNGSLEKMQFYENMRYPKKEISYNISSCSLQKEYEMKRAFEIVSNLTVLQFYPTNNFAEISVTCEERTRPSTENGFFVAGEGGPVNITNTTKFNVILNGEISLIRDSKCPNPNIGIHELFHALGFKHSENSDNVMYNITTCNQQIGPDISNEINRLYSVEPLPDLSIENASAFLHGKYLDANITIKNEGLSKAGNSTLLVYADGEKVKSFDIDELKIGHRTKITLKNLIIFQLTTKEIEFFIEYSESELEKDNNKIRLEIKK